MQMLILKDLGVSEVFNLKKKLQKIENLIKWSTD